MEIQMNKETRGTKPALVKAAASNSPRRHRKPKMKLLALVANCAGNGENDGVELIGDVEIGTGVYRNFVEFVGRKQASDFCFNNTFDGPRRPTKKLRDDFPLPKSLRRGGPEFDLSERTLNEFSDEITVWLWRFYLRLTKHLAPDLAAAVKLEADEVLGILGYDGIESAAKK
jgi:hypothetical protein